MRAQRHGFLPALKDGFSTADEEMNKSEWSQCDGTPPPDAVVMQAAWVVEQPVTHGTERVVAHEAEPHEKKVRARAVAVTTKILAFALLFALGTHLATTALSMMTTRVSVREAAALDLRYFGESSRSNDRSDVPGQRGQHAQMVLAVSQGMVEDEGLRIALADAIARADQFEPLSLSELRSHNPWAWIPTNSDRFQAAGDNRRQITALTTAVDDAVNDVIDGMGVKTIEQIRHGG